MSRRGIGLRPVSAIWYNQFMDAESDGKPSSARAGNPRIWAACAVVVLVISVAATFAARVSYASRLSKEIEKVRRIIVCLRLCTSEDGQYPKDLNEIVKAGAMNKDDWDKLIHFDAAADHTPQPWIIALDLGDWDPGDLPLVISPTATKDGKYVIGMNDSSVALTDQAGREALPREWRELADIGADSGEVPDGPWRPNHPKGRGIRHIRA